MNRQRRSARRRKALTRVMAVIVALSTLYALLLPAFTLENETTCGLEEHVHSDECMETVLICGQEESEEHTHTEECRAQVPVCGHEEHEHSLRCYSDPEADLENALVWEHTLPAGGAESDGAQRLAAAARSQLGYTESARNYLVAEDGEHIFGYTRYGAWYGQPYAPAWSGLFAAFCMHYAGLPNGLFDPDCAVWQSRLAASAAEDRGGVYVARSAEGGEIIPIPGELVFLDLDWDETADHVGVVTDLSREGGTLTAVSGDLNDRVDALTLYLDDASILAYLLPCSAEPVEDPQPEAEPAPGTEPITGEPAAEEPTPEEPIHEEPAAGEPIPEEPIHEEPAAGDAAETSIAEEKPSQEFYGEENGLLVSVSAPEGAFPRGVEMRLTPVEDEAILAAIRGAVNRKIRYLRAVDITFYYNNVEIEPLLPIQVTMTDAAGTADPDRTIIDPYKAGFVSAAAVDAGLNAEPTPGLSPVGNGAGTPVVVHVNASGSAEAIRSETNGFETTFQAGSFSVYALVYTVDFAYDVDGKTFVFSLAGGSCVSLRELLPALHVLGEGVDLEEFLQNVESVTFSDESLVKTVPVNANTTAGQLKEALGLEIRYSAELSAEQIAEMDATPLTAPDWALISLGAFDSAETLTVTMADGETFTVSVTDAQISANVITSGGESYTIDVIYDDDAGIPEGAELQVSEILPTDQGFVNYLVASMDALGEQRSSISFARFFDIRIVKDGQVVEPLAPVQVRISYTDALETGDDGTLKVIHFADEGVEVIDQVTLNRSATAVTYEQSSFSVTGTIINNSNRPNNNDNVVVILKDGDTYYQVLNDGSLEEITVQNGQFTMEHPMVWTYERGDWNQDHITHKAFARSLNDNAVADSWYNKYLDPGADGINDPVVGSVFGHGTPRPSNQDEIDRQNQAKRNASTLRYENHRLIGTNGKYLGIRTGEDGKKYVSGGNDFGNSVEVYFARVDVDYSLGGWNNPPADSCNHIDISVVGKAEVAVPLAYGDYYDAEGNLVLSVSAQNPVTLKLQKDVDITEDDIKNATVEAFSKDANGVQTPVDNAFYITSYSGNAPVEGSTAQVRIEGVFKVTRNPYANPPRNERIYYSVSTVKNESFPLVYNGIPLYSSPDVDDPDREPITAASDVTLSASFDYWDERNECPGIRNQPGGPTTRTWNEGRINAPGIDGMDFVLGSTAEGQNNLVAVEIVKYLVDTNGNVIETKTSTSNSFDVYLHKLNPDSSNELRDADTVIDLDKGRYDPSQAEQEASAFKDGQNYYHRIHSKKVNVGTNGMGAIYDYAVDPGMVYVREDPDSITKDLTDKQENQWTYHHTRIETEYVWRQDGDSQQRHVSRDFNEETTSAADYRSIPDVLGSYLNANGEKEFNGFLEFYVYNVYVPTDVDLTVKKEWKEGGADVSAPEGASVTVFLKRYKLEPDSTYYDTGRLYISKSFSGATPNGFAASYTVTGNGQTYQIPYSDLPKTLYDLAPGSYTVTETVTADGAPGGYAAWHSEQSQTVTVTGGQQTNVSFQTRYAPQSSGTLATVEIYNSRYGRDVKYSNSTSFYTGDTVRISWQRAYNSYVRYQINGGGWIVQSPYPPNSGPEKREESFIATIPESGRLSIEISDSWNTCSDFKVERIGGTANSAAAPLLRVPAAELQGQLREPLKATAVTVSNPNVPVSTVPGMKYVVDEDWPEAGFELASGLVLTPGEDWTKVLEHLDSYDANGSYVYAIDRIVESGVPEGTAVTFGPEGTSEVVVTNNMPADFSVTKAWSDGDALVSWPEDGPDSIQIELLRSIDGENYEPAVDVNGNPVGQHTITRDQPTTVFTGLPYADGNGTPYQYKANEVTTPNGYRAVVTRDAAGNFTITNVRMSIHVVKVDENGRPLPGAEFTLYKDEYPSGTAWTKQVDPAGAGCTFKDLPDSIYYLEETQAPPGYAPIAGIASFTVAWPNITVNDELPEGMSWDGETFTLTVKNVPVQEPGKLTVQKRWQDLSGNAIDPPQDSVEIVLKRYKNVPGSPGTRTLHVVVQLRRQENNSIWASKEITTTISTDSARIQWQDDGQFGCESPRLTWGISDGSIKITDNITNHGHAVQPDFTLSNFSATDQSYITVTFTYRGYRNDDQINSEWFAGVIRNTTINVTPTGNALPSSESSWAEDPDFSQTLTLNKDNNWSVTQSIDPNYRYYIEESSVPEGFAVTYSDNNGEGASTGMLTAFNRKTTADMRIVKVDRNSPETPLPGAEFTLHRLDGGKPGVVYLSGQEAVTARTNGDGTLTFTDLVPGYYEIRETRAPEGYVLSGESAVYVKVSKDGVTPIVRNDSLAPARWTVRADNSYAVFTAEKITVTNVPGRPLPETGGRGTGASTLGGLALLLAAGVMAYIRFCKRRRPYWERGSDG